VANPLAGLQVQFADGDRLHVHIVTHFLQRVIGSHATDKPGLLLTFNVEFGLFP
jgi:hypothetical protein